jgi:hypothetical protein
MIIIIVRSENFVAHLDGLGGTPVCRGTPVAHHCSRAENENVIYVRPYVRMFHFEQQSTRQTSNKFDIGGLAYAIIRRTIFNFDPYHFNVTTLREAQIGFYKTLLDHIKIIICRRA